jgi:2-methylcitrate dehydratase PrpD
MNETSAEINTRTLIGTFRDTHYDSISSDALEVARHCLLDHLGVALAGSSESLVQILLKVVARNDHSDEAGFECRPAEVLGVEHYEIGFHSAQLRHASS